MLYGPPPISPADLIRLFTSCVCPAIPTQRGAFQSSRRLLTDVLYSAMREAGERLGFEVRHKAEGLGRDDPRREFLWDHTWLGRDSQLALVMESEWSGVGERVLGDFKKLLYAKAPVKILAYCEQAQNLDALELMDRCIRAFAFHTVGEQYLIVNLRGWSSGTLEASLYLIEERPGGFDIRQKRLMRKERSARAATNTGS